MELPERTYSKMPELSRIAVHRLSRGIALTCLIVLALFPITLVVLRWAIPNSERIRFALFWLWLFLSPLLAGAGLLLTMLALVVVNAKKRKTAVLLGILTTIFLVFMSQML